MMRCCSLTPTAAAASAPSRAHVRCSVPRAGRLSAGGPVPRRGGAAIRILPRQQPVHLVRAEPNNADKWDVGGLTPDEDPEDPIREADDKVIKETLRDLDALADAEKEVLDAAWDILGKAGIKQPEVKSVPTIEDMKLSDAEWLAQWEAEQKAAAGEEEEEEGKGELMHQEEEEEVGGREGVRAAEEVLRNLGNMGAAERSQIDQAMMLVEQLGLKVIRKTDGREVTGGGLDDGGSSRTTGEFTPAVDGLARGLEARCAEAAGERAVDAAVDDLEKMVAMEREVVDQAMGLLQQLSESLDRRAEKKEGRDRK